MRLFFQFYGTFSSLVRCYFFFPAVILQSPAPELLAVYYGYYGFMSDVATVQSQTSFRRQEAGSTEYGYGWGRNIAAGALELLEHSAATVMAERRAFAQKISR